MLKSFRLSSVRTANLGLYFLNLRHKNICVTARDGKNGRKELKGNYHQVSQSFVPFTCSIQIEQISNHISAENLIENGNQLAYFGEKTLTDETCQVSHHCRHSTVRDNTYHQMI